MKSSKLLFSLFFLFLSILPLTGQTKGQTDFILVRSAFMIKTDIYKPNAALMIKDKERLNIFEDLFFDNHWAAHACGYDYLVEFWDKDGNLIYDIPFNTECQEFERDKKQIYDQIKKCTDLLETKPGYFIYNLQLPATVEPGEVKKTFENSGLNLLFIDKPSERYSSLTFSYLERANIQNPDNSAKWADEEDKVSKKAVKKIESVIDSIKLVSNICEQSEISFPSISFGGGQIEHKGEVTLKFKNGTDLSGVRTIILRNKGEIEKEKNPGYYYIQLIDSSDKPEEIKQRTRKYKIVKGVYEYPNKK